MKDEKGNDKEKGKEYNRLKHCNQMIIDVIGWMNREYIAHI
jgi:hypothetical protein